MKIARALAISRYFLMKLLLYNMPSDSNKVRVLAYVPMCGNWCINGCGSAIAGECVKPS